MSVIQQVYGSIISGGTRGLTGRVEVEVAELLGTGTSIIVSGAMVSINLLLPLSPDSLESLVAKLSA